VNEESWKAGKCEESAKKAARKKDEPNQKKI